VVLAAGVGEVGGDVYLIIAQDAQGEGLALQNDVVGVAVVAYGDGDARGRSEVCMTQEAVIALDWRPRWCRARRPRGSGSASCPVCRCGRGDLGPKRSSLDGRLVFYQERVYCGSWRFFRVHRLLRA
jgi:hypothetical protein